MLPQLSQFQQTNVLLEKPDVVNYSPFIPNILQINRLTGRHGDNGATKLEFLNCQTKTLLNFHRSMCLARDSAVATLTKSTSLCL